jgi:hypothetical protein
MGRLNGGAWTYEVDITNGVQPFELEVVERSLDRRCVELASVEPLAFADP